MADSKILQFVDNTPVTFSGTLFAACCS